MFLLGHIGISAGFIYTSAWMLSRQSRDEKHALSLGNIDFRLVIIAAMLPDIIDKGVGLIILKEELSNGRIFTHSLLVVGTISLYLAAGYSVKSGHVSKSLYYMAPLWMHLLLDRMWEEPKTLFWPLLGTHFPRVDIEISDYFAILFSEPYILFSEVLGGLIIVALFAKFRLFKKNNLYRFLRYGKINGQSRV